MFTIAELSRAFEQPEETILEALWFGGHSPVDYGFDGNTPVYSRAAAEFLADRFPRISEPETTPVECSTATPTGNVVAKLVPGEDGTRCQL